MFLQILHVSVQHWNSENNVTGHQFDHVFAFQLGLAVLVGGVGRIVREVGRMGALEHVVGADVDHPAT
mgnify:CR=1 FL=1